jgi:hypothetical protein
MGEAAIAMLFDNRSVEVIVGYESERGDKQFCLE